MFFTLLTFVSFVCTDFFSILQKAMEWTTCRTRMDQHFKWVTT